MINKLKGFATAIPSIKKQLSGMKANAISPGTGVSTNIQRPKWAGNRSLKNQMKNPFGK